jgi:hypothetical protein
MNKSVTIDHVRREAETAVLNAIAPETTIVNTNIESKTESKSEYVFEGGRFPEFPSYQEDTAYFRWDGEGNDFPWLD